MYSVGSRDHLERLAVRILAGSVILSLLFHLSLILVTNRAAKLRVPKEVLSTPMEVGLIDKRLLDAVDSFQETAKEKPKKADFASSRDMKADEETSPTQSPTNVATSALPRAPAKPTESQQAKNKASPKKLESFSLSESDLLALNDPLQNEAAPHPQDHFSPGFVSRLKKGESLKVNALGLDYGQYLIRMKERIIQRWNPRRTITPKMYSYNEVIVTLAVVLNNRGELVDLKLITGSFFPEYDQEAIDAFKKSAPFPNPPNSLIQDDGRVYLPWSFHLTFNDWASSSVY